jgi:hypothetical protein
MNIKKKPTTIDVGNRVSGSGQTQKMWRRSTGQWYPNARPLDNLISNGNVYLYRQFKKKHCTDHLPLLKIIYHKQEWQHKH